MFVEIILVLLIALLTAFLIHQYVVLPRMYYTSCALERLRELRFKTTNALIDECLAFNNGKELENNRQVVLEFIYDVDKAIINFDSLKRQIINFRSFKNIFLKIEHSTATLEKLERVNTGGPIIRDAMREYARSLLVAFKAIPFFKGRVLIHLAVFISQILMYIGISQAKAYAYKIQRALNLYHHLDEATHTSTEHALHTISC